MSDLVVGTAALPPDIRRADTRTQQTYKAALGFERMLVEQLSQSLASSATSMGGDGDGGDGGSDGGAGDAASQQIQSLLPGALADAVTQAGGLGLARTLTDGLKASR